MAEPGDGTEELRAAERAVTLRDGLRHQLQVAVANEQAALARAQESALAVTREQGDVARLEQMSMARIWAGLKGSRETDLEREQAEARAAEYAAAEATERLRTARVEVTSTEARLVELGDVDGRLRRAVELREAALAAAGGPVADGLTELARTAGSLEGRRTELEEAVVAARTAEAVLGRAAELLGSAGSWAAWDTFGGGGFLTDAVKYQQLDRAAALIREADAALVHLSRELADVGVAGVAGVEVTELTRMFDVWFDNIFTDWAVRNRIAEASARVDEVRAWVGHTLAGLDAELGQVHADLASAEQERARLRTA